MPKLQIDNLDINYNVTGEGQTLLFIHGLGSSGNDWEEQVEYFSKNYQVVTFDVRGHGQSGKPPGPYSVKLFTDDTATLVKLLDLSPVHVIGISMGGMIAFQLAVDYPQMLKSMTIVNSGPELIARSFKEKFMIFQRSFIFRLLSMKKIGEILSGRLFPKEDQEEQRSKMIKRWAENDKRAYMESFKAIVGWSVTEFIENIKCPTLVIAADEDYTPVSLKEEYAVKMIEAKLVVVNDSRHGTPMDQPEEFNKALEDFLSKLE